MRKRWLTIGLTLVCFALALLALPSVPRQFFPASDRPELVVDLTLPQNASIFASDRPRRNSTRYLKTIPTLQAGAYMSGAAPSASTFRLMCNWPNDFFSQAVVVAKDVAARERLQAMLEESSGGATAERGVSRIAAGIRAARRLASAIQSQRA